MSQRGCQYLPESPPLMRSAAYASAESTAAMITSEPRTLLRRATQDGSKLASQLGRLLSFKDAAHYGVQVVSTRNATDAIKWAERLVERAREESER